MRNDSIGSLRHLKSIANSVNPAELPRAHIPDSDSDAGDSAEGVAWVKPLTWSSIKASAVPFCALQPLRRSLAASEDLVSFLSIYRYRDLSILSILQKRLSFVCSGSIIFDNIDDYGS